MDLKISEMIEMSKKLHDKNSWNFNTEYGQKSFLLLIGEIGETIEILMKIGSESVMKEEEIRSKFIEELADTLTYFANILNCYDISAEEFAKIYRSKFSKNMKRDFTSRRSNFKNKTVSEE